MRSDKLTECGCEEDDAMVAYDHQYSRASSTGSLWKVECDCGMSTKQFDTAQEAAWNRAMSTPSRVESETIERCVKALQQRVKSHCAFNNLVNNQKDREWAACRQYETENCIDAVKKLPRKHGD
jgi:hypothetical protein